MQVANPLSKRDNLIAARASTEERMRSDQQQHDTYGQTTRMKGMRATMNCMGLAGASALQPIQNPNVRNETQGQNMTALADGTIVYY